MAEENKSVTQPQNQITAFDRALSTAKSVKDLFEIPDVKSRALAGYKATTGREDGEHKFQQERYAYLDILHNKPELREAPMWTHFKVMVRVMQNGWSLRDNRIYLQPVKKDNQVVDIKVDPSPAVRREMLEAMRTDKKNGIRGIKSAPEAQVVVKGDIFVEDKLNHRVLRHEGTEKSLAPDKLENILYSYQRIIWEDGEITDVVVPQSDLFKARAKSKVKNPETDGVWLFPAEASKKTATNRSYRLYHKYAHNEVLIDDDEDTKDAAHEDVTSSYQEPEPVQPEVHRTDVDLTTGEELHPEPQVEVVEKRKKNLLAD